MRALIKEDAICYLPNGEHKNFTQTDKYLKAGSIIEGQPKAIIGKRRGEDFTYRMFVTNDGNFIHLNKVGKLPEKKEEPISSVEAEASKIEGEEVVDYIEKNLFIYASIAGALIGFGYAKLFKKEDAKSLVIIGSLAGALGSYLQITSDKKILNKKQDGK